MIIACRRPSLHTLNISLDLYIAIIRRCLRARRKMDRHRRLRWPRPPRTGLTRDLDPPARSECGNGRRNQLLRSKPTMKTVLVSTNHAIDDHLPHPGTHIVATHLRLSVSRTSAAPRTRGDRRKLDMSKRATIPRHQRTTHPLILSAIRTILQDLRHNLLLQRRVIRLQLRRRSDRLLRSSLRQLVPHHQLNPNAQQERWTWMKITTIAEKMIRRLLSPTVLHPVLPRPRPSHLHPRMLESTATHQAQL